MSTITEAAPRGNRPRAGAPSVEIKIDRHFNARVYTSGSTISGHVLVKTQRDVAFDDFEILLVGIAHTRVDFVQQYATHTARPFMKLRMPLRSTDFPNPRVFKAGRHYTVPFHFVVPHHLTLGVCNHKCQNHLVQEQHMRLPPSMGCWEDNDQAPDMAQVEYALQAHAFRTSTDGPTKVLDGQQVLRMMPSLPEDAPLDITEKDERFHLSKSKTIRKNLMTTKVGKMTVKSSQPSAVMLSADAYGTSGSSLRLNLEFDPASADAAPPKINNVTAKIQSTTFYTCAPMDQLPELGGRETYRDNPRLAYSTHSNIHLPAINKVNWAKKNTALIRRDSGYSSWPDEYLSESDSPSNKKYKSPFKHVASLDLPFELPTQKHKFFLPTFHSCLISRTYILHVTLSVGPLNTNLTLALPLQIAVENLYDTPDTEDLPSFESAMAQAEADAYLQPRLMQVPSARFRGNSVLPGYSRQPLAVA